MKLFGECDSHKGYGQEPMMDDMEAKRLRDSLVEYEGYLREMRQVTLKNVETLDVIQRYTDKSAAGMQKLAEQSLDGIQRVTAESAGGLRRIIETGTSNLSRMAEAGESNINLTTQECLKRLQSYTEAGMAQIDASCEKNQETAAVVEKIEQAILEHMEAMKTLMKQSDDFTHKENVKVYRNVQAVVVDEVKKQTEAMAAQNEELVRRNEMLQKQNKGMRPLMIVTLIAALANIGLVIAQIAGLFG
ncbi:MAG: hypothetical protein IJ390_10915 [Lachnospiraceae bacterium]|nr:hypothetical protein [Lachnospiraceae bacterium]